MKKYRPEIDGLRAVAVIPVILFHAGFGVFSGGYIGVDVFFVISGYLITALIISELETDSFSLANFYERRARRILPALILVVLCCIPFAWLWMLPLEFRDFSQSLVALALFASNIQFWRESNYFEDRSGEFPLLHTWSLAIEEQFYIIVPLMMLMAWRFGKNPVFYCVLALTVVSFSLSEYAVRRAPVANFFLLPTRAWELGIGALCAFWFRDKSEKGLLALLGIAMIVAAIFLFDENTPFPSRYALLPVIGTALVILYSGAGTLVARVLSFQPIVAVGLVSYSAYLWHQPVFAFARIRLVAEPSLMQAVALIAMVSVLAYLSWRFVERPFRRRPNSPFPRRRTLFALCAASGILVFAVGAIGHFTNGLPQRLGSARAELAALEKRLEPNRGLHPSCDEDTTFTELCQTTENPSIMLWGDSYAMHLAEALSTDDSNGLQQHTMVACSPVWGLSHANHFGRIPWAERCINFNDRVIETLRESDSIKFVVISSIFSILHSEVIDRDGHQIDPERARETVKKALLQTVREIQEMGKAVVLVSRTPSSGENIGQCIIRSFMHNRPEDGCDFEVGRFDERTRAALNFTDQIAKQVPVISLPDFICDDTICDVVQDGVPIFRDAGHLSAEGTRFLGAKHDINALIRETAK